LKKGAIDALNNPLGLKKESKKEKTFRLVADGREKARRRVRESHKIRKEGRRVYCWFASYRERNEKTRKRLN